MESSEEDPDIRNDIIQPPSYAEAIQTTVPLPLPPYRPVEPRSRSPPPPYSEVIGQTLHDRPNPTVTSQPIRNNPVTVQPIRSTYQSLDTTHSSGQSGQTRHAASRSRPRQSSRTTTSWRTTELQIPRGHSDATENLIQQVRRPPGSLPHLRLLRPSIQDPRRLRNGFPTANNKKIIHILAGGLGLLIPLGVIIAMATRETTPEVETATQLTTPSVYYYMDEAGGIDININDEDNVLTGVSDVHLQPFRRKRRRK